MLLWSVVALVEVKYLEKGCRKCLGVLSSDPDKMRENDQNGETDLKTCKLGGQKRTKKAVSSVFKCSRGCLQEERCIRLHIWNYGVRTKTVGGRL